MERRNKVSKESRKLSFKKVTLRSLNRSALSSSVGEGRFSFASPCNSCSSGKSSPCDCCCS